MDDETKVGKFAVFPTIFVSAPPQALPINLFSHGQSSR
jgi:hypothetical protein